MRKTDILDPGRCEEGKDKDNKNCCHGEGSQKCQVNGCEPLAGQLTGLLVVLAGQLTGQLTGQLVVLAGLLVLGVLA